MDQYAIIKQIFKGPRHEFMAFSKEVDEKYGSWSKYLNLKFNPENFILFLFKSGANETHIEHIIHEDKAILWMKNNNTLLGIIKHLQDEFYINENNTKKISTGGKIIDILIQKDERIVWARDNKSLCFMDYLILKDVARFNLSDLNSKELEKATKDYIEINVLNKENLLTKIIQAYEDKPHSQDSKKALQGKIQFLLKNGFLSFEDNQNYTNELNQNDNFWHKAVYDELTPIKDSVYNEYNNLQKKLILNINTSDNKKRKPQ